MRAPGAKGRSGRAQLGLSLWAANLGVMAAGFVAPLALARLASPEDYGRFSFATAVLATCSILTAPGLTIAVTQGAARGQHGTLRLAMASRVRWSISAVVVVMIIGGWFVTNGDRMTGAILIAVGPLVIPVYGLDLGPAFLNGLGRFGSMILLMLAGAALPAGVVAALLLGGAPIVSVTIAYFATLAATNIASLVFVHLRHVRNSEADPEVIRYGKRLSWISSLGAVQFYFDRLVIGASLGFADLAIYSAAKIFQQGLKSTWGAVNQQLVPALATRDVEAARDLTRRTLIPVWLGFVALCAVGVVLVPTVVIFVFGRAYEPSITPARLLLVAVAAGIPGAQFEMLFRAVADERRLYIQRITFAIAEVAFTGAGAWAYGVTGASVGMVVAYTVNSLVAWVLVRSR